MTLKEAEIKIEELFSYYQAGEISRDELLDGINALGVGKTWDESNLVADAGYNLSRRNEAFYRVIFRGE